MTKKILKIYIIVAIVSYLVFAFSVISIHININNQIPEVSAILESKQQLIIDDFNNVYKLKDCTIAMDENEIIVTINDSSNISSFQLKSSFDKDLNFKFSELVVPHAAELTTVITLCVIVAIIIATFLAFVTWIYYKIEKQYTNPTT